MSSDEIKLQVGVKIALKNNEGKILMLRRNKNIYPEIGDKWDIPGGRINPLSSLNDNLEREVFEETQIKLIQIPVLLKVQDIFANPSLHVVRLTYKGYSDKTPILSEEHDAYDWFSIEEIKEMGKEKVDKYFLELIENNCI